MISLIINSPEDGDEAALNERPSEYLFGHPKSHKTKFSILKQTRTPTMINISMIELNITCISKQQEIKS